jgi:hypothetical protein
MFTGPIRETKCSFCGKGALRYEPKETFLAYSMPESFVLDEVDELLDGIIGQYIVYKCDECGAIERYTLKDIEKMIRKEISRRVINAKARAEIIETKKLLSKRRIMVYCGRCNGFDGKGSCLLETFKNCKLKRIPNEL